jgi:RimJ/RimL family protein N-acetyltransferase
MLVPVLTTARLTLRGFCESDLGDYAALQADPEVMRHLGAGARAGRTRTRDESWTDMALMLGQWALKGYGSFALEETASGRFVGRAGILHLPGWPEPELAFALVRSAWGQGFAEEACRAILPWAFSITGAERLVSSIKPGTSEETSRCSSSVWMPPPSTPSPSSVGTPIAPVKFPSEPPPAELAGRAPIPIARAIASARACRARPFASGSQTGRVSVGVMVNRTSGVEGRSAPRRATRASRSAWVLAIARHSARQWVGTQFTQAPPWMTPTLVVASSLLIASIASTCVAISRIALRPSASRAPAWLGRPTASRAKRAIA